MNHPLCVLLPVYNAQHTLESGVNEVLDVIAELTAGFDLYILDDGSTDDTADVGCELAARYPQVRFLRHPIRLGLAEAIQTGLDHTDGEVILIGDEGYSLDPDDLRTLWQLRETQRRIVSRSVDSANKTWLAKLLAWKPQRSMGGRGFQVIVREAFERFRLEQALEMVRRVDRAIGESNKPISLRPIFLDRSKHAPRNVGGALDGGRNQQSRRVPLESRQG